MRIIKKINVLIFFFAITFIGNIAYGARPRPTIPANSVLIFEVELLDIVTKK